LLAPVASKGTQHLRALAQISKFLRDEDTCQRLRDGKTIEALATILDE
jgi:mannitol/fructose-specific phosphotransferase system IIA component (Ntr-type)